MYRYIDKHRHAISNFATVSSCKYKYARLTLAYNTINQK